MRSSEAGFFSYPPTVWAEPHLGIPVSSSTDLSVHSGPETDSDPSLVPGFLSYRQSGVRHRRVLEDVGLM